MIALIPGCVRYATMEKGRLMNQPSRGSFGASHSDSGTLSCPEARRSGRSTGESNPTLRYLWIPEIQCPDHREEPRDPFVSAKWSAPAESTTASFRSRARQASPGQTG